MSDLSTQLPQRLTRPEETGLDAGLLIPGDIFIVRPGESMPVDGEVLDALQELARLVVMTETGHRSRLMLDVAGYRERRRAELVALAKDAIAEVKETGEQVLRRGVEEGVAVPAHH